MTERERLIELMNNAELACLEFSKMHPYEKSLTDFTTDYLLANGVIVPPCKVGDTVWVKDFERCCVIQEAEITEIVQNKCGTYIRYEYPAFRGRIYARSIEYIGKTVFLAKEEAEQALKGGAE